MVDLGEHYFDVARLAVDNRRGFRQTINRSCSEIWTQVRLVA